MATRTMEGLHPKDDSPADAMSQHLHDIVARLEARISQPGMTDNKMSQSGQEQLDIVDRMAQFSVADDIIHERDILTMLKNIVKCRKNNALLNLVGSWPRGRRVAALGLSTLGLAADEVQWAFDSLYNSGPESNRHVALRWAIATFGGANNVLGDFICRQPDDVDLRKKRFKKALDRMQMQHTEAREAPDSDTPYMRCVTALSDPLNCSHWRRNKRWLFTHVLRVSEHSHLQRVCDRDVALNDLKLAFRWAIFVETLPKPELYWPTPPGMKTIKGIAWTLTDGGVYHTLYSFIDELIARLDRDTMKRLWKYGLLLIRRQWLLAADQSNNKLSKTLKDMFESLYGIMCNTRSISNSDEMRRILKSTARILIDRDESSFFSCLCYIHCGDIRIQNNRSVWTPFLKHDYISLYRQAARKGRFHFFTETAKYMHQDTTPFVILTKILYSFKAWDTMAKFSDLLRQMKDRSVLETDLYGDQALLATFQFQIPDAVEFCLGKLLKSRSIWEGCGGVQNQWLTDDLFDPLPEILVRAQTVLQALGRHRICRSLLRFCVRQNLFQLALFLGNVLDDGDLISTVLVQHEQHSQGSLDVRLLSASVHVLVRQRMFGPAVKVLVLLQKRAKFWEDTVAFTKFLAELGVGSEDLALECQNAGLHTWVILLSVPTPGTERHDWATVERSLEMCQEQLVLEYLLISSVRKCPDFTEVLLQKCTFSKSAKVALLKYVFRSGLVDVASMVLKYVDPRIYEIQIGNTNQKRTLFDEALPFYGDPHCSIKMIPLLISSGLSTYQRQLHEECPTLQNPVMEILDVKFEKRPSAVRLMVDCGVAGNAALHDLSSYFAVLGDGFEGRRRIVDEAAHAPRRLTHLARLTVSHAVGTHPGRADRIEALPLPRHLKDLIHFKDILDQYRESNDHYP